MYPIFVVWNREAQNYEVVHNVSWILSCHNVSADACDITKYAPTRESRRQRPWYINRDDRIPRYRCLWYISLVSSQNICQRARSTWRRCSIEMTKVATTGAKKSIRKSEYVFHLHFHDEGVAVAIKRVLMLKRQTEIFRFRSFQLTWLRNVQMQSSFLYMSVHEPPRAVHFPISLQKILSYLQTPFWRKISRPIT